MIRFIVGIFYLAIRTQVGFTQGTCSIFNLDHIDVDSRSRLIIPMVQG